MITDPNPGGSKTYCSFSGTPIFIQYSILVQETDLKSLVSMFIKLQLSRAQHMTVAKFMCSFKYVVVCFILKPVSNSAPRL
jgi:hypothetical protein